MVRKVFGVVLGLLVVSQSLLAQEKSIPVRPRTITGEVQLLTGVSSTIMGRTHDIIVWLPPQYAKDPKRKFPVLYMGDGQNLFNLETSYLPDQEWRVDEAAQGLAESNLIDPPIIVGIYNAGQYRADEYLPTRVRGNGGDVAKFGRMLVEELKPMIDQKFRTKRGRNDTGVAGSSFGGIMTLCVGQQFPKTFGKLAIISPSVWWDNRYVLKTVADLPKKLDQKIWVDTGTLEGSDSIKNAEDLRDAYVAKGWKLGKDLAFYLDRGARHSETAWASRIDSVLLFLFPSK